MNTQGYQFDIFTNTLTLTEAFARRASKYNAPEYKILMKLRADNPGLKMVKAEKRMVPKSITFKEMEGFISQCGDKEKRLKEFEKVKVLAKIQPSPYSAVKAWFAENYANYAQQPEFDENGFLVVKTRVQMEAEEKDTGLSQNTSEQSAMDAIKISA